MTRWPPAVSPACRPLARRGNVYVIELSTASPLTAMSDPGYSAVRELLRCSLGQPADPERLLGFQPTEYYPRRSTS